MATLGAMAEEWCGMNNVVAMTVYNQVPEQLELTKRAVASVLTQDIPVDLILVDNGSTDDTWEWMRSLSRPNVFASRKPTNISPIQIGNEVMADLFRYGPYLLGVPNDAILPRNFYREMLRWPRGIVTASMGSEEVAVAKESKAVSENTPMAAVVIRRWVYDALMQKDGYFFDPNYFLYASDCDLALRIAACGIRGVQLDLPYYHYSSASWRMLPPEKGKIITDQADRDREYFMSKWGFRVDDLEYGQCASDPNFRG